MRVLPGTRFTLRHGLKANPFLVEGVQMNPLHRLRQLVRAYHVLDFDAADKLSGDPAYVDQWVAAVTDLDQTLTGHLDCRNDKKRDIASCKEMLDGDTWEVYLSDGGHSRVYIDVYEGNGFVRLDRILSLATVKANWDRLAKEPE